MEESGIWLVKSSGRILGPWNKAEIEKALRSREIVPLDEIASPFQRWRYIRDERAFDQVISELRTKRGPSEITQTNTNTDTMTDATDRIYQFAPEEELTKGVEDQLKEAKPIVDPVPSQPVHITTKTYQIEATPKKASSTQNIIWGVLILIIGVLTVQLVGRSKEQTPQLKTKTFEESLESANALQSAGLNGDAITAFRQALDMRRDSEVAKLGLAISLVQNRQTTEARTLLESAIQSPALSANQKAMAYLALANSALSIDDFATAKRHIEQGQGLDSKNAHLKVAMAHVFLNESKPKEAAEQIRQSLDMGLVDPIAALLMAEADFLAARDGLLEKGFESALNVLKSLSESTLGFRQEALALRLHVLIESKQIAELEKVAAELLDTDPKSSEDYIVSPHIYAGRASWDHLQRYLKRSLSEVPSSSRTTAVLGYAMFRGREKLEGKRVLEDALSKNPSDRLVRAVLSYVQSEVGREDEARAGLTIALEDKELRLPLYLKARLCRQNREPECYSEMIKDILSRDPNSPFALSGMAWAAFENNKQAEAAQFLQRALMIAPTYQPILKLKLRLERKI